MKKILFVLCALLIATYVWAIPPIPYATGIASITGGTIDNTPIGTTTPREGDFTVINISKVSSTPGTVLCADDYLTDNLGDAWMGSHQTGALNATRYYQFPTATSSGGQTMVFSSPNGSGVQQATYMTPMPSTGTGLVEEITVIFSSVSGIPANMVSNVLTKAYAVSAINQWTVNCNNLDATAIIIDVLGQTHASNTLPATDLCATGTKPTGGGAAAYSNQAAWNCGVASFAAHYDLMFKVVTPPSTSTVCTLTMEVTR